MINNNGKNSNDPKNDDWYSPEEMEEFNKSLIDFRRNNNSLKNILSRYSEKVQNGEIDELEELNIGELLDKDIEEEIEVEKLEDMDIFSNLTVTDVCKDITTNIMTIELLYKASYDETKLVGTATDVERNQVVQFLTKNGIIIMNPDADVLSRFIKELIINYINTNGLNYTHSNVGWMSNNRSDGFLWSKSICAKRESTLIDNDELLIGECGDKKEYDKMLKNEVLCNKNLHLVLTLGFTSALIPIMAKDIDSPNILVNFAGVSSKGKSTSMCLLASIWGKGDISNSGKSIIKTFSTTKNALESSIGKNLGIPIVFDDYSTAPKKFDFKGMVYDLIQGESKQRTAASGKVFKTNNWSTLIVTNGESTIFNLAGNNAGLQARVIEILDPELTSSEKNAVNIKSVVAKNYGFYGPLFIEKLQDYDQKKLSKMYKQSLDVINTDMSTTNRLSGRVQLKMALVRMTAVLVNKMFNFKLDVDYLTNVLIENEKKRIENYSIDEKAKEEIVELINRKLSTFVKGNEDKTKANISGKIWYEKDCCYVALMPKVFNTVLDKYNDKNSILKKWKDEKFLIVNENESKYQKPVRINTVVRCYVLCFNKDFFDTSKNSSKK